MCGLFGVVNALEISGPSAKSRELFLNAATYLSALRGTDGTGFCLAGPKGTQVYKDPIATWNFIQTYQYQSVIKALSDSNVIIGHARSKTIGAASHTNTHPFEANHITLAHNGTLNNMYQLPNYVQGTTDSEVIAINMSRIGEKETLELLEGSYALTWYNKEKGTFNIARNDHRTLYTAMDEEKQIMYYMSDSEMLRFALYQGNIKINQKFGVRSVAAGTWYIFSDKVNKWQEQKFVVKKPDPPKHQYWHNNSSTHWPNHEFDRTEHPQGNKGASKTHFLPVTTQKDKKVNENTERSASKYLLFKVGDKILVEIDNYYNSAKGITVVGSALIDEEVKVIAPKQDMDPKTVGEYYDVTITSKSIKNGKITLFVDDLVPVAREEVLNNSLKKNLVCGYCDAPIPREHEDLTIKVGESVIGVCCKDFVHD